jgi:hypothetical protein
MSASGDLVIGKSGDRKRERTAETRSRGEDQTLTTEARRHGERSGDPVIARDRVIGVAAGSDQGVMVEHTINLCHPERIGANATASRRTPTKTVPELAASGSSHETTDLTAETLNRGEDQTLTTEVRRHGERSGDPVIARDRVIKIMQTIKATLCEIFDESAYDRFLLRTHESRSVASYRDFTRERDADTVKKPRCC